MNLGRSLLVSLLLAGGCGSDATLLIIETQGLPDSVQSLRLTVTLEGKRVAVDPPLSENLDNFGIELPSESSGALLIEADGLDATGCLVSSGRTDTILAARPRVRLHLEMSTLPTSICTQ